MSISPIAQGQPAHVSTNTTFQPGDVVILVLTTDPEPIPGEPKRYVEIHCIDKFGVTGFTNTSPRQVSVGSPCLFSWSVIEMMLHTDKLNAVKGGAKR